MLVLFSLAFVRTLKTSSFIVMAGDAGIILFPRFIVKYDGLRLPGASSTSLVDTGILTVDRGTFSIHLNLVVLLRFSVPGPTKLFLRIYTANAHSGHYNKEITPPLRP